MAFDEQLAKRLRAFCSRRQGFSEKKMFGGLAFMLHGNMCFGVIGTDVMVRIGPDAYEDALKEPGVRAMDFTGRPMRGMVYVAGHAIAEPGSLDHWLRRGVDSPPRCLPSSVRKAARTWRK